MNVMCILMQIGCCFLQITIHIVGLQVPTFVGRVKSKVDSVVVVVLFFVFLFLFVTDHMNVQSQDAISSTIGNSVIHDMYIEPSL